MLSPPAPNNYDIATIHLKPHLNTPKSIDMAQYRNVVAFGALTFRNLAFLLDLQQNVGSKSWQSYFQSQLSSG